MVLSPTVVLTACRYVHISCYMEYASPIVFRITIFRLPSLFLAYTLHKLEIVCRRDLLQYIYIMSTHDGTVRDSSSLHTCQSRALSTVSSLRSSHREKS